MPDQPLLSATLVQLDKLLQKAQSLATPQKERTLFSLAGKGHYENPASDLLGFFFDPAAEHNFGPLFLKAFFDCMGVETERMSFGEVIVRREARTVEGKLIDLLVQGKDWVLVVENKIHHIQNNPFLLYESHAEKLRLDNAHFAVLSPSGTSTAPHKWKPVSYKNHCRALRKCFANAMFDLPHSKWVVFAREFVLHFENELYDPVMTKEQFQFVEQHLLEIEQVKSMATEYTSQLIGNLQSALRETLPTISDSLKVVDEGWAFRCVIQPKRLDVAFQTPKHAVGNTQRNFRVIVYISDLNPEQEQEAAKILAGMARGVEDDTAYWTQIAPDNSSDAIKLLCSLAQKLSAL